MVKYSLGDTMGKQYKIYIANGGLEYIGKVRKIEQVVDIIRDIKIENFMVVEHDDINNWEESVTFKVRDMLKEENDVSRGAEKVYRREKS